MRESQDPDEAFPLQVCDVIWEAVHGHTSSRHVVWNACDSSANLWPLDNSFQCGIDSLNELQAKTRALAFVPKRGVFEFSGSFGFRLEGANHGSANRRMTRARTSSHGSPTDSPVITRRARRSISRAQAASTSAGFVAGASSRLASSSAATSALSSTGSVNASRRRSCAREVIWTF